MSVEQLMDVLYDIKLDRNKKIPSKYLNIPDNKLLESNNKKKNKRKYQIYRKVVHSGGSYPATSRYFLDRHTISARISHIKSALLDIQTAPPPLEIGIFTETKLHPDDLRDARRELLEHQQRQMRVKETWSESWMKSKFPIYCRILTVLIKLIICCLSCRDSIVKVISNWMYQNFDILSDFFLGLFGSVQAYSRYTALFSNVPIFGPIFRVLFSLFKFIFEDIGGQFTFGIMPMMIRIIYNLITTLRPYFNTVYRYWIVIERLKQKIIIKKLNPLDYLPFLFSLIMILFEKNLPEIKGIKLIRIPLLSQNLWSVFNEIIDFTSRYNFNLCDWCEGKKGKQMLNSVSGPLNDSNPVSSNPLVTKTEPQLSLGEQAAQAVIPSSNSWLDFIQRKRNYLQDELSKADQIIRNSKNVDQEGFNRFERKEIQRVRDSPLSLNEFNSMRGRGRKRTKTKFGKKRNQRLEIKKISIKNTNKTFKVNTH